MATVTSELIWIYQLLSDLQLPRVSPSMVYCDTQVAIAIASNPTFHKRTKHIEIDCHFVRDKVNEGFIQLFPIRSNLQLAESSQRLYLLQY